MGTRRRIASVVALVIGLPLLSIAGDGRIEINQAIAQEGGVNGNKFLDPAGFPIVITEPGSYQLTGNLDPGERGADSTAIIIAADDVTLDLGGFVISGPGTLGSGDGIAFVLSMCCGDRATIVNGTIRDMGRYGINLRNDIRVDAVTAQGNGADGIKLDLRGMVTNSRSLNNNFSGLNLGDNSIYALNSLTDNALESVHGGAPSGGNYCDDGRCSTDGRRLFYLKPGALTGNQPLSACPSGFHMASRWEIFDPSALRYSELGFSALDSGAGPPSQPGDWGWVRTGGEGVGSGGTFPPANCDLWTSNRSDWNGLAIRLRRDWRGTDLGPWDAENQSCDTFNNVWCVQN